MVINLLLLLLPLVALSGWYIGRKKNSSRSSKSSLLPQNYFVGLNYLINEEPDKAVDIFIKMLEVNSDTFETYLALGSLFRRRGEVDRAIRIHQNLIARPQLNKQQRIHALSELAQDYLRAGVLDRAERLFMELAELGDKNTNSAHYLLNIYQQQKDWEQAIVVAKKIETIANKSMRAEMAHYYCELAEGMREKNDFERAQRYLKQAAATDPKCVRASILQGELQAIACQYKAAIRHYKQVKNQDPDYISEIVLPLARCYERLGNVEDLTLFLQNCLAEYPRISVVLVLAEYLRKWQSDRVAIDFIATQIQQRPSWRGVDYLIELYLANSQNETRDKLLILRDLVKNLLANKPIYRCTHCGFSAKTLYWQCPSCRQWNSVKPIHGLEGD